MPSSYDHPDLVSNTESIEAIVARYSSPAPSSSSPMPNQPINDSSPQNTNENDNSTSLPSSPPIYFPSNHGAPPSLQHRRSSTHSGYFSRGQLFGRYPTPERESTFVPQSKAMEQIEARRHSGLTPLPDGSFSSLGANRQQENNRVLQNRPSIESLRSTQNGGFSTPNLRSSLRSGRNSSLSMRRRFSDSPRDEWMEAGTPDKETAEGGVRSDFVWKFKAAPTFDTDPDIGNVKKTDTPSVTHGQSRKVSPAEIALREAFKKGHSTRSASVRNMSWVGKMFSRRKSNYQIPGASQSRLSDEDPLNFGYVEPQVSAESPKDILARIEARKAAEQQQGNLSTEGAKEDEIFELDDSYVNLQDAHDETCPSVASSPCVSSSTPSQESDAPLLTSSIEESSEIRKDVIRFSLTPIMATFDQAPVIPVHGLAYAAPTTILSQAPVLAPHRLTMSPIQATISQSPITLAQRQGLTFSDANAIIYACISFAAMHIVLLNMGEDIRAIDIAYNMSVAFVIGVALCVVLHWAQGGRINDILRAIGYTLGTAYHALLDGFRQARGE